MKEVLTMRHEKLVETSLLGTVLLSQWFPCSSSWAHSLYVRKRLLGRFQAP